MYKYPGGRTKQQSIRDEHTYNTLCDGGYTHLQAREYMNVGRVRPLTRCIEEYRIRREKRLGIFKGKGGARKGAGRKPIAVPLNNAIAVPLNNAIAVPLNNAIAVPLNNAIAVPLNKKRIKCTPKRNQRHVC